MTETTFTSSKTGNVYRVVATPETRIDYGKFMDASTKYERNYTQYSIYLDNKLVQFCFAEQDIPEAVDRYENPWPDISSPWD